jgi:integrase
LVQAQRAGEAFEVMSGLPLSLVKQRGAKTLLDVATAYVDWMWDGAPGNTRRSVVGCLGVAVPLFCRPVDHQPAVAELQRLLSTRLLPPQRRSIPLDSHERAMASWLTRASRPLADLTDDLSVGGLLTALGTSANGRRATSSTWDKRRAVLHRCVAFAVDSGWLAHNPLSGRKLAAPAAVQSIDPRVVVNPDQARELLAAVTYVVAGNHSDGRRGERLHAFFACLYYGGLRPGEAMGLRDTDLVLPEKGWGELRLARSFVMVSGADFADSPDLQRPLKRRRPEEVRMVPIPPALVVILREHLGAFGVAVDGRLFRGLLGAPAVPSSVYTKVWQAARAYALRPAEVASPLARRPYDLRHAALSSWLNAGVPPTDVAERAGHSVAVLLSVYAKCLHGQQATYNARIDALLGQ